MLVVDKKVNDAWSALSKELNIKIKIDGVVYDKSDVSSLSFDSASIVGDAFQIGSAYMNQIQVEFPSIIESIAQDLEVTAELGIYVDGAFHYSKLGTFLISEFDRNRNERKTTFTAVDRMVLLEGSYVSKLSYPASIRNVALEIANLAGVVIDQVSFSTLPTTTIAKPEGYTYRQAIGLIAQFVGGFANFNREGKLQVRTLALTDFALTTADYMWGGFTKNESTYRVNGIQVITGDEESNVLSVGADKGNVIQLENKVMTQALLNTIWQRVQNINYFPYELKWFGNPNLEAGDWINIVDHDGVRYSVPNLSYSFTYNGGLRAESKATTTSNSEVSYRYKGTLAQKIIEIEKVLTAANGWNSNYYDQTHPPLHPKEGDAWFKPNGAYTEIWLYKNVDGELKWVLEISNAPDEAIKKAIENMEQEVQTAIDQSSTAINNASQAIADAGFAKNQSATALSQAGQAVADANTAITDAQSALDSYNNMEIGQRNYILNSERPIEVTGNGQANKSGYPYSLSETWKDMNVSIGDEVTISFDIEIKGNGNVGTSTFRMQTGNPWFPLYPFTYLSKFPSGKSRVAYTYKINSEINTSSTNKQIGYRLDGVPVDTTIVLSNMKIEKGNKATDWSPAPEDVQVQITDINGELSRKVSQQTFDTLQGTVNTQSTQINQNKADIQARATKTEVNTLTGTVNSLDSRLGIEAGKITALNSKTDGHTTQIGSLESSFSGLNSTVATVKQDLDGLEIGGRNLLRNTNYEKQPQSWNGASITISKDKPNNYITVKRGGNSSFGVFSNDDCEIVAGETYTLSLEVRTVDVPNLNYIYIMSGEGNVILAPFNSIQTNGEWTYLKRTFTSWFHRKKAGVMIGVEGATSGNEFSVRKLKLEKGNKATDWSPAPEDMATVTQFSSLEQTVNGIQTKVANKAEQSEVTQLAGQWSATVAKVDGHTGQISNLGDQINLRLTKAQVADEILNDKTAIRGRETTNDAPQYYYDNYRLQKVREYKNTTALGLIGNYSGLLETESQGVYSPWPTFKQTFYTSTYTHSRSAIDGSTWGSWARVVDSSNVLSQINLSEEGVLIQGKNIWLDGNTKINDAVIKTAHIADLAVSGAKIANASISSAKIISLDASKITVGTLTGHTINSAVINGGTISGGTINGTNITGGTFYNSGTRGEFHVYDGMVKATSYNTVANGTILSEDGYITLRAGGTGSASHVFLQSVTEVRATRPREFSTYIPMVALEFRIPGWTYLARNVWSTYGNGIEDMFIKPSDVGSLRVMSAGNGSYRPIMASAFNQSSSREFKENIESLQESGLEVIRGFNIVTYNLKDDPNKEIQVGLIAEDNRAISSFEGDSINIYKMTSYNSKAIQELDASLDTVTQQLTTVATERLQHTLLLESKLLSLENTVLQLQQEIEQLRTV